MVKISFQQERREIKPFFLLSVSIQLHTLLLKLLTRKVSRTTDIQGRTYFRPLVRRLKIIKKGIKPLPHPKQHLYYLVLARIFRFARFKVELIAVGQKASLTLKQKHILREQQNL